MGKTAELLLEVGAAGGSISIWAVKDRDGNRSFIISRDESTLKEFMDEEDLKGISFKSKPNHLRPLTMLWLILGDTLGL